MEIKSLTIENKLPKHKCGLFLTHNEHKNIYQTAEEYIKNEDHTTWESEEHKQKAINTNEIWTLQWYPETPIGFYEISAPTLEDLLNFTKRVEGGK
jgi:hypothetical protein